MKFYRFELAFDGTPQGVGFLQGVDDIGLSNKKFTALMDPFDKQSNRTSRLEPFRACSRRALF